MARLHPATEEDLGKVKISGTELDDLIRKLSLGIERDQDSVLRWIHRQVHFYKRRYARIDRRTSYPWPGASDVIMPTIDMTIERLKAVLLRLLFTRPQVTFESFRPESHRQARSDEVFFNWLLRYGIPDYKDNVVIAVDQLLQTGFAVVKTIWDYRTHKARRIFNSFDIPIRYREMLVAARTLTLQSTLINDQARNLSDEEILKTITDQEIQILSPQVAKDYGIDTETPAGRKTLDRLLRAIRNGENGVRYEVEEVLRDNPAIVTIPTEDLITQHSTYDLDAAPRVSHRIWVTESGLRDRAVTQGWAPAAVDRVLDSVSRGPQGGADRFLATRSKFLYSSEKALREGVDQFLGQDTDLIELHEVHFNFDIDGDGRDEKVVTIMHLDSGTILKDIRPEPYEHGMRPFDQIAFEINDERFYSPRGVPEKISDIDWEITFRHRSKLNKMDMMVPMFKYRAISDIDVDSFSFIPGGLVPVMRQDDLEGIQVPDTTIHDEREELNLLTWNERYLGGFDALATQGAIREARTATEIQALRQAGSETMAYRGEILQMRFKRIYLKLWYLWNQWGDPDVYERVTGGSMQRLTPVEIRGTYDIVPVGTVETSDPQLEAQKAFARMQALLQIVQANGGTVLEGTHKIDLVEALQRWLDRDNINDSRAIIRPLTAEERQQLQQQQQTDEAAGVLAALGENAGRAESA